MMRRPPRSTRFPYTALFGAGDGGRAAGSVGLGGWHAAGVGPGDGAGAAHPRRAYRVGRGGGGDGGWGGGRGGLPGLGAAGGGPGDGGRAANPHRADPGGRGG